MTTKDPTISDNQSVRKSIELKANKKSSENTDRNSIIVLTGRSSNHNIQLENQDLSSRPIQNKIKSNIPPIMLNEIQHGQIIERKQ